MVEVAVALGVAPRDLWDEDLATLMTIIEVLNRRAKEASGDGRDKRIERLPG